MPPKPDRKSKDGDDDLFVRLQQLIEGSEQRMKAHFTNELEPLKKQLQKNTNDIATVTITAHKAITDTATNAGDIEQLRGDVTVLTESNNSLKDTVNTLQQNVDLLSIKNACFERRLEDQTNRSLRKTLVIRGVPEEGEESWAETRLIAVDALVAATKLNKDRLCKGIERIHRGNTNSAKKKGKRDIFALFYDWNLSNAVVNSYHKHGRSTGIFVDQMHGPDTAYRRSLALHRRKELIGTKVIAHGYVEYPAKLMVKYTSEDPRYVMYENFSNAEIPLTERMPKR